MNRHLIAAGFVSGLVVLVSCTGCVTKEAVAPEELRLHVDASLRANAVYHLACLARSIACTNDVFDRFWKDRLHESPADREAVASWRRVLVGTGERSPAPSPAPILPNAATLHPGGMAKRAVMAAAFQAQSSDEMRQRAPALGADEAIQLMESVNHFEQRLRPWWQAEGERSVRERARRVEETARKNGMPQAMVRMARFLESDPPHRDAYLHLIAPPEPQSKDYTATAVFNHLPIEAVDAADNPDDLVHGAVHELTHYLYDYMSPEKHRALIDEFIGSGVQGVSGIYSYLHEAIAVAAQVVYRNGLPAGENKSESDDKGYQHPYIPVLASAASPLVVSTIASGGHLDRAFVKKFIDAAVPALGSKIREPRLALTGAILVFPKGSESFADTYQQTMFPVTTARFTDMKAADGFPDANVVQFATYAELDRASSVDATLKALRSGHRGIVYASPRGRGGYYVVIAGPDAAAVLDVIRKFGDVDTVSGPGVLVKID